MGVCKAAPQCSPAQPLGSSPAAIISGRRVLSVEASVPQVETLRSRERPEELVHSPHGQDRQQILSPRSRTHCACCCYSLGQGTDEARAAGSSSPIQSTKPAS